MGNYCSEGEVLALKINGTPVDLSAYDTAEINAEINLAEAIIERFTNDIFFPDADTKEFDGNSLTRLFFIPDTAQRLVSINSVTEVDFDGTTVLDTFVEDVDFKKYDYFLEIEKFGIFGRPRRRITTSGGVWPKGNKNISIDGTWGRATVPLEIKRATCLLVIDRLRPGTANLIATNVKKATWDDFAVEFNSSTSGEEPVRASTGFLDIDRLLEGFINYADLFHVIPDDRGVFGQHG